MPADAIDLSAVRVAADHIARFVHRTPVMTCETLDRLEHDLHVTLLGYCRNRALVQAITAPQSLIVAHRFLYRWTSRLFASEPFLPEHLEVVERLEAGCVADAAKALEAHLRVSRDRAMARVNLIARRHGLDTFVAARGLGVPGYRIVLRHLLPSAAGPMIVAASLGAGAAINAESALSFLGLGIQPPTPSWGNLLFNAQTYLWNQPWIAIFPGVFILLTLLFLNFIGDGLRDALDPRFRSG